MSEPVPAPPKTYRIDVIDEETGQTVQSVRGVPERHMSALLRTLSSVGGLLRDFKAAREAIRRTMERG